MQKQAKKEEVEIYIKEGANNYYVTMTVEGKPVWSYTGGMQKRKKRKKVTNEKMVEMGEGVANKMGIIGKSGEEVILILKTPLTGAVKGIVGAIGKKVRIGKYLLQVKQAHNGVRAKKERRL